MNSATLIRECRHRAGLTLRQLAERANTSPATLSAYEHGRVVPRVDTLSRIVHAAGFVLDGSLARRRRDAYGGPESKGDELAAVIDLAFAFPFRRQGDLEYPPFGAAR